MRRSEKDDGHTPLLYAMERGLKDGLVCPIEGETVAKPDALLVTDRAVVTIGGCQ